MLGLNCKQYRDFVTMHEEYKYYKRTHNNTSTTYFMLTLKYLAPTLVLSNVKMLPDQSQKARIKPNTGGLIISHF